jgi:dTDP-4-dehydrorhamnose reductase
MKIVVIGADGMLGRAVSELFAGQHELSRPTLEALDITREDQISREIADGTYVVINCAAYTNVDGAEQEEALATRINGHAVGLLANRCRSIPCTLVHYSTDYVFDGQQKIPYPVDGTRAPLGAYGRSKLVGEEALEHSGCDFLLLRTSWLYGPWGKNFVLTMLGLMKSRPELKVVHDQVGRPSSVLSVARATQGLLEKGQRGTFHVTDAGETSWFGFAGEIAKLSGAECQVFPCTTEDFPRPAPRPGYSVLDIEKTEHALGPLPAWQEPLRETLETLGELG